MLLAAFPAAVQAQTAVAPSAPTREELGIDRDRAAQAIPQTRLFVKDGIERGPCPLSDPSFADMKVNFSKVTFANLTAVDPSVLDSAWRGLAGQPVSIAQLCEVRDRAATMLRDRGYLAAVQIPPQRIEEGGEVRMDVLVAKLVELQVRGDVGPSEKLIAAHLAKLTSEKWFNVGEAERHLLLLNDLPGYDVRLTLRPAKGAPGEVVGDVLITRRPIEIVVGAQNLGSRAAGREGVSAQIVFNGLTGLGDRTYLSFYNTVDIHEQTVVQLAHEFALGSSGLRLGGSILYGRSEPKLALGKIKTETLIGNLELSYPLIRRQSQTLRAAAGFDVIDQSIDFAGTRLSEDNLRIAYARLDFEGIDADSLSGRGGYTGSEPKWRIASSLELRQGISGLGASNDCTPVSNCTAPNVPISNFLADPSAFVARLEGTLEYRPVPTVTIALSPRLQWSSDTLLNFEQYSLGNYTIGRGFDPGTVLGDKGAGTSVELRLGKITPKGPNDVAIQPYGFLDAAWAWNNDGGLTSDPRRVYSAGGGVRGRWGNHLDADLTVAAPLKRAGFQTTRGDVRVLFTIRARLVPWDPS